MQDRRLAPIPESPSAPDPSPAKRIRILYIVDSLWSIGGAELCLLRMTQHLPKSLFECHVLTFHAAPQSAWFLERFDCPVYHWQLNNMYDWTAIGVAAKLWRFIRDQKIDIVHSFFQTADLWAAPIAKLAGAKAIISSRRDMGILRRRKHHFGYRLMSGLFDQIHTVSECVRQYTIEHDRADPARTITVHNGIDPEVDVSSADVDRLRQTLGLKPNAPVVITVANSRFVKGLDVLLRAAALVTKEVPEAQFIVVGGLGGTVRETAFNQRLLQLHASLGISNCVKFVGKSTEVNALLALSDVFVLPSRSEGLSNALLEAMRAGLPCVATSVGGNPEVVVDGKTGFLVPAEDCETLADRIHRVLRDPGMRDAMGRAGRARLLERFTVQRMLTDLVASYHLALAGNRTPVQPHFAKHALS